MPRHSSVVTTMLIWRCIGMHTVSPVSRAMILLYQYHSRCHVVHFPLTLVWRNLERKGEGTHLSYKATNWVVIPCEICYSCCTRHASTLDRTCWQEISTKGNLEFLCRNRHLGIGNEIVAVPSSPQIKGVWADAMVTKMPNKAKCWGEVDEAPSWW